ncbi:Guanylate cyclase 32E [Zootermopsis nevadensis]|uniref:Guanylate cyclase n=2 Tax=Zootermopsis nevadensis TaxID=136037 RepID=A0A067RMP4_ZOONE|nr:Guanylate cyclase 32E [Zootermopsis nevadensis]
MISYKCADIHVSDKRVYYTFARTLPPSSKVSKSVVALLLYFKWTKFIIVAGKRPAWGGEVQEAVKDLASVYNLNITDIYHFSETDYVSTEQHILEMEDIVTKTYQRTRVYVFVGEHIALVDFVYCLQRLHLLDKGEYIIISVDDEIYDPDHRLNIVQREYLDPYLYNRNFSRKIILGFRSVLKLTPSHPRNPKYKELCEQIKNFSLKPPFCVPYHEKIYDSISVPIDAAHLYDAVMIYARALTEVFQNGEDPRNGSAVLQKIRNRSYHSVQGYDVFIDGNGDAEGNYTVVALLDDETVNGSLRMSMQTVGYFQYTPNASSNPHELPEFKYFDEHRKIQWVGGVQPQAEPPCGFQGEKCIYKPDWRVIVTLSVLFSLLLVGGIFAFKHYRYEQKLACLLWKIDMRDVTVIPTETAEATNKSMIQVCRQSAFQCGAAVGGSIVVEQPELSHKRAYTRIGLYRGNIVAIKLVYKRSIDITRNIRKELKQIREVRHDNLIPFIGACVDHGNLCVLTAYCARGSLEDVLANKDLHLDNMFVSSLVSDILKGMIYLHDSEIMSHGNLRSSNCLVDSRWVLQITDFGLHEFKGQEEPDHKQKELRRHLWQAPELLRSPNPPPQGTQKGDVYSFAIVLYEIMGRAGPWGQVDMKYDEIVERVRNPAEGHIFRPPTERLGIADYVSRCMQNCWDEDPEQRPDIRYVRAKLKEMQAGLKSNIFDNMLAIMEKYAYNLEGLVQERTNQLVEEKKKTEALLHRMLPKTVAEALKRGDPVEAESFDCVTIYFSDIVGFTELSAVSTPLQVVDLLNDLYTCCDSIISNYDVYKVETIGDAYMVVSGLPVRNDDRHAGEIASMALHLLKKIKRFEIRHRTGEQLRLRVGIHSGQCVAGVVGLKMPRYCLFGDTVNTASRMESSGEAFRIHISEATHILLDRLGGYYCEERGLTQIKGKGEMQTYWLVGEDPAHRLARIGGETIGSAGIFSSDRSNGLETPDLLRHPTSTNILSDEDSPSDSKVEMLHQLHMRAFKAYTKQQEMCPGITASCSSTLRIPSPGRGVADSCARGHHSAPTITFQESSASLPGNYV